MKNNKNKHIDILPSEMPAQRPSPDEISPKERIRAGNAAGIVGICVNFFLCIIKLIAGIISGSVAVTADSVNNLSDAGSSLITAISFKMSGKPADTEHPYGHARLEYIAGLIVSFVVTILGVELAKSSIAAIISPEKAVYGALTFIILAVSVGAKVGLALFYKSVGRKINSVSLDAAAADSISDVLSTSVVIIGAIISRIFGIVLDGWLGAVVAGLIIYSGVKLIMETSNPLLGIAPDPETVREISNKILSYDGVIGMHDLMIHNYGSGRRFASAHVEVPAKRDILESHDIIDNIENDFLRDEGLHMVLHLDPVENDNEQINELKRSVQDIIALLSPDMNVHDFRVVFGTTHTNLIFDIMVPITYPENDAELCHRISHGVKGLIGEQYNTVITVDRNYDRTVNEN